MIFEIGEEEEKKIKKWLNEIRVEDINFPRLMYMFSPGDIGMTAIVKELITNKELDVTDLSKW